MWVSVKQAAEMLGVSDTTIRNWIKAGIFPAYQLNPTGRILLSTEDIDKAIRSRQIVFKVDL